MVGGSAQLENAMAFSVRLTGFSAKSGEEIFKMEPSWWPASVLREDPRMTKSATGGYLDFMATLSVDEARAVHELFRPAAVAGVFGSTEWQEIIGPMMAELDAVFGPRSVEFGKFELCVFEWESGLGE